MFWDPLLLKVRQSFWSILQQPPAVHTGQCPSLRRRSDCSHLLRYAQVQVHPQTVNNGRERRKTTEPKNAPPLPTSKRRHKKTDEEKQCKRENWTEPERKTRINISISEVEGAAGFLRTPEQLRIGGISVGQVRTPAWYMFHSVFNHKAKMAAVTVS